MRQKSTLYCSEIIFGERNGGDARGMMVRWGLIPTGQLGTFSRWEQQLGWAGVRQRGNTTTRKGFGPWKERGGKTEENSALRNVQHRRWKSGKEEKNKRARGRRDDDGVGFFVCSSLRSLPPPSPFVGHRKMGRVFGLVWSPPPTTDEAKRKHYRRCGKIVERSVLPVCVLP